MRKLFIGCGVVVALILGVVGYVGYRLYPTVKEMQGQMTAVVARLDQLDAAHPFDPQAQDHLDTQRFASTLELRLQLIEARQDTLRELDKVLNKGDKEVGFFDGIKQALGQITTMLPKYADDLEQAGMGPLEFAYHTKLFWSALSRVDAGAAGPELDPVKGQYARFKDDYDRMARDEKLPALDVLLGTFPPAILAEATTVLASDVERVQRCLVSVDLDYYFMAPLNKLRDLSSLHDIAEEQHGTTDDGPPPAGAPGAATTPAPAVTKPLTPPSGSSEPPAPAPAPASGTPPAGSKPDAPK